MAQAVAKEVLKFVGKFMVDYLIDVLRGTCHDYYTFVERKTGGAYNREGFTHMIFKCPTNLSVDWFTLLGYPTTIVIFFGPGSRIRDMINSRYSEHQQVGVQEFIDWLKTNLRKKIENEGAEIELSITHDEFERRDTVVFDAPMGKVLMKYKKATWTIRVVKG